MELQSYVLPQFMLKVMEKSQLVISVLPLVQFFGQLLLLKLMVPSCLPL
jgi:hypothetical protein